MILEIIEYEPNTIEIIDEVIEIEIVDFDSAYGKVPMNWFEAAGDILVGIGNAIAEALHVRNAGDVLTLGTDLMPGWSAPSGGVADGTMNHGRLTLESGVPVSITDQADKSRVYFTPWTKLGNLIGLDDGNGTMQRYTLTEIYLDLDLSKYATVTSGDNVLRDISTSGIMVGMSASGTGIAAGSVVTAVGDGTVTLDLNATGSGTAVSITFQVPAGKGVDIFCVRGSSANELRGVLWSGANARVTSLAISNGLQSLTGESTYRYIGSVYCESAGLTQDIQRKRHVYNYQNQVRRKVAIDTLPTGWSVGDIRTWRNIGNAASYRIEIFSGMVETELLVESNLYYQATAVNAAAGIGLCLNAAASTPNVGSYGTEVTSNSYKLIQARCFLTSLSSIGKHYIQPVEYFYGYSESVSFYTYRNGAPVLGGGGVDGYVLA